ncbi:hypothetical protein Bca52824_023835 [Brassica carinata]|uniref:Helicase ATP-binding domain-containing protein n=1 Tax=Brassica carinata TaxID=52824 RepID=A0A8X8AV31_BRACI|nr:hypothetical protein Bca52824_023835 [Brassica carinata]
MENPRDNEAYEEELLYYEEEDEKAPDSATKVNGEAVEKDFLLKRELLRAIFDSGFEHPSEGKYLSLLQHECIPQAILGMDVICQAKSGTGKTAVFVLPTLQQIEPTPGQVSALILCHSLPGILTYLPDTKVSVFYGGVNNKIHKDLLKNECPHILVGTPGRVLGLARDKYLSLKNVRHFSLDECDKMLECLSMLISNILVYKNILLIPENNISNSSLSDMRRDVQEIFKVTPSDKQVMMFSATLSKVIRPVYKKFMQDSFYCIFYFIKYITLHTFKTTIVFNNIHNTFNIYLDFFSSALGSNFSMPSLGPSRAVPRDMNITFLVSSCTNKHRQELINFLYFTDIKALREKLNVIT